MNGARVVNKADDCGRFGGYLGRIVKLNPSTTVQRRCIGVDRSLNNFVQPTGTDPLAIDSYAVTLANWNQRSLTAERIRHLSIASGLGVGEIEVGKINTIKETI